MMTIPAAAYTFVNPVRDSIIDHLAPIRRELKGFTIEGSGLVKNIIVVDKDNGIILWTPFSQLDEFVLLGQNRWNQLMDLSTKVTRTEMVSIN